MDLKLFIKNLPLFQSCSKDSISFLIEQAEVEIFHKNSVIFREDSPGNSIYLLNEGQIAIVKRFGRSNEKLLSILSAGEIFGEMSLFSTATRTATAISQTESTVVKLSSDAIKQLFSNFPQEGISIVQFMLHNMGSRLERTSLELACIFKISQIIGDIMLSSDGMIRFLSNVCSEIYNTLAIESKIGVYVYLYNPYRECITLTSGCYDKNLPIEQEYDRFDPLINTIFEQASLTFNEKENNQNISDFACRMQYDGQIVGITLLKFREKSISQREQNLISSVTNVIAPTVHNLLKLHEKI